MKKICEVKSLLFDDYLILSLDGKWLDVFGEMPTFEASLDDNGKLRIISKKSVYKKKMKVNLNEEKTKQMSVVES